MYYREKWYLIKGALDVSIPICTMDPTPTNNKFKEKNLCHIKVLIHMKMNKRD